MIWGSTVLMTFINLAIISVTATFLWILFRHREGNWTKGESIMGHTAHCVTIPYQCEV